MSCLSCFGSTKDDKPVKRVDSNNSSSNKTTRDDRPSPRARARTRAAAPASCPPANQVSKAAPEKLKPKPANENKKDDAPKEGEANIAAQTFQFKELVAATNNFRPDCFLGEGGFGRVYKGRLESTGQVVAVKQLDRNGLQGNREFLVEVLMLSLLHHPNLVNLIGYCADGDQRLLVYEYMPLGSLEDHLHDLPPDKEPLDWNTRMKIAAGAAKGLEYLHAKANPPVIYRDFKSSNILLDEGYHAKLSDFGLAKLGPVGDKTHVSTRVMGTYGYCAPEYAMTGQLTVKSDVYSFGVVLLELITGRKAIDNTRPPKEQNLVNWARPLFKDRKKFAMMADPLLKGNYPMRGLYQALAVAAMCLQDEAGSRPLMGDVVTALSYLASQTHDPGAHPHNNGRFLVSASNEKRGSERKPNDGVASDRENEKGSRRGSARHQAARAENSHDRRIARMKTLNGLTESGGSHEGSGRESGDSDRSDGARDSPKYVGKVSRESGRRILAVSEDRERALAEAKSWGENYREKKIGTHGNSDSPR